MEEPLLQQYSELTSFRQSIELGQNEFLLEQPTPIIQNIATNHHMNRIQRICDAQYQLEHRNQAIRVELDLSLILIREMKADYKVTKVMMISTIVDMLIRLDYYVYLLISLTRYYDDSRVVSLVIYLLIVPRVLLFLCQVKILTIQLHKLKNQSILQIITMFRQNFTYLNMDEEARREWYDWRGEDHQYDKLSIISFLLQPNESTYTQLYKTDNGIRTYIVSSFIHKTIEMITFVPVFMSLLYFNHFIFDNKLTSSKPFDRFTITLVYMDILKYIFISAFYLTKRNYQINKLIM